MTQRKREVKGMDAAFCDLLQTRAGPAVEEQNFVIAGDGRLVMVDPAVEHIVSAPHVLLADSAPAFPIDPHHRGTVTFGIAPSGTLEMVESISDAEATGSGHFGPAADEDWEGVYRTLARGDDRPATAEDVDGVLRILGRGRPAKSE